MFRRSNAFAVMGSIALFALAGCSQGKVPVGTAEEQLQTRSNGSPTGDGTTCAWEDPNTSVSSEGGETVKTVYQVGDKFKALDGCNDCTCTDEGITCTEIACDPNSMDPGNPGASQGCSEEAKVCPDGSTVVRSGPSCEFAPCPSNSSLGPSCDNDSFTCSNSAEECYYFSASKELRCASNPCSVCADPSKCSIQETFPPRVDCN